MTRQESKEKECDDLVVKQTIVRRERVSDQMSLVLYETSQVVRDVPLLIAFSDVGITPMLVASHYVDQLKLPLIGALSCRAMGPSSTVKGGQPGPSIQIYGNEQVAIVMSEAKIKETSVSYDIVDSIVQVAKVLRCPTIFSAEGVPVEKIDGVYRDQINFVTSHPGIRDELLAQESKPLANAVIAGITGGVLAECSVTEAGNLTPEICVLLIPTSSMFPDAMSAVIGIKHLDRLWGKEVSDLTKLEEGALAMERKVKDLFQPAKENDNYLSLYG